MTVKYGVILPCRNEEDYIEGCINSLLNQTIKPLKLVVVDDNSNDDTPTILKNFQKSVDVIRLNNPRYGIKGLNTSIAVKMALEVLLKHEVDYILNIDADSILPDYYIEYLIKVMESDAFIGFTSGYSHRNRKNTVSMSARLGRSRCIKDVLSCFPNAKYPIMHGHDVIVKHVAYWRGWKIVPSDVKYQELRGAHIQKGKYLYLKGWFRYQIGFPLHYQLYLFKRDLRYKPQLLAALIILFSYIISSLIYKRILSNDFYHFMKMQKAPYMIRKKVLPIILNDDKI